MEDPKNSPEQAPASCSADHMGGHTAPKAPHVFDLHKLVKSLAACTTLLQHLLSK